MIQGFGTGNTGFDPSESHPLPYRPIGQESVYHMGEAIRVTHAFGSAFVEEMGRHLIEIVGMGSEERRTAEPRSLQRIMSAKGDQRSADESQPGEAIE